MKQRLLFLSLLVMLMGGSLKGWGQVYLIDESFEGTFPPTNWTNNGCIQSSNNPRTGMKDLGFNGVNDEIITSNLSDPGSISFWYRRSSNTTAWTLKVYYSSSSSGPWTEIGSITNSSTTYQEFTYDLTSFSNIFIRLLDQRVTGTHERYVDDFKITQDAGNTAPTVTTQAPTAVLTTTATGNGNITATGGVAPTARGFCWDLATNADPDVNDSKVEENGTFSTGAFTGSITGLTAGTQYKVRAYAINTEGTSYGSVQSFYTLSTEPSAHAASFSSSTVSQTQIDLSFSAASTITNAAGYLVLQRTAAAPTGAPADGSAYSVGNAIGDGTVAAVITTTDATTASITGLSAGTQYYFTLFPFNWDGATNNTYNYKTDGVVPGTNTTTTAPLATTSEVSGPALGSQPNPVSISSLLTTDGSAIRVFDMDIFDYGVDSDPTKVTQLTIKAGTNNTANWANSIQGIKLSTDGGATFVTIGTPTIAASSIVVPVSSGNLNVPNNDAITVSMYIYLKSSGLTDNQILEFKVDQTADSHGFLADATGSTFATTFASAPVSNEIIIDVVATKLAFVQQPTNVATSANISPAVTVSANDANDNRDLDYVTSVAISATGLTGSPVSATPVSGLATFSTLSFASAASGVTLDAASGSLSGATSSSFNVLLLPTAGEIVINQISPDYSGASDEYVELVNRTNKTFDLSQLKLEYQSSGGTLGGAGGNLSGVLGPFQYWLLSPNASITVGQTSGLSRNGSITAGFAGSAGQIALKLKDSPYTIIDGLAYGSVSPNNLGEGTASTSPPADGGLKRVSEGIDNNANSTDFTTVTQANIYLRNSNSVCIASSYELPATSYSADVVISGSAPAVTLSGNTTISGKLSVLSGSLSIDASEQLTVSGTLTNNATEGIVLKSPLDHGAPGSLIVNGSISGSGTIKAERYIQAYSAAGNGWHLISSPVNNVNIASGTNLAPGGTDDLYAFNETAYEWTNYKPGNVFTTMENGKGYLVSYAAAATKQFVGTPNNAAVTFTNLSKTAGEGNGWHLIGNPFQSAISWNDGGWTLTNIGGVAKRMSDAGSYTDVQANDIIPAMQGFFVQAENATNTLTIPLSARTHNSAQNWTKSGNANSLLLVAHDPAQAMYQESRLNENPAATEAYDYQYDSRFVPWYAPEFYSLAGNEMLSTNSIPDFSSDDVIPFGFKKNGSAAYYIELKESPAGLTTYLTDTKTGIEHNFADNAIYSFTAAEGDSPTRFLLHFGAVGVSEQPESSALKAYVVGNQLYFPLQGEAILQIVDLQGRVLQQSHVAGQGLTSTAMQQPAGAYVVRLVGSHSVQTAKVIVK